MLFVIDLLFDKTFSNYWYCDARILKHLRGLFGNYRDIRILFNLFSHDFFIIKCRKLFKTMYNDLQLLGKVGHGTR